MTLTYRTLLASLLLLLIGLPPAKAEQLVVVAASSLTGAPGELAESDQAQNPGEQILLNFAGSLTLPTRIEQGAPANLSSSADLAVTQRLENRGLEEKSRPLFPDRLVLAARADLSSELTQLKDLVRPNLFLAKVKGAGPGSDRFARYLFSLAAQKVFAQHGFVPGGEE